MAKVFNVIEKRKKTERENEKKIVLTMGAIKLGSVRWCAPVAFRVRIDSEAAPRVQHLPSAARPAQLGVAHCASLHYHTLYEFVSRPNLCYHQKRKTFRVSGGFEGAIAAHAPQYVGNIHTVGGPSKQALFQVQSQI